MKRKTKVYQIDQSGKIEQTSLKTIIAISNGIHYSIVLSRKVKRLLQEIFRNQQRPRMFVYDTFAALIALVFVKTKPVSKVMIDKEYRNEDLVKARILEFLKMHKINYNPNIEFGLVGKLSPAHILAAKVANKKTCSQFDQRTNPTIYFYRPVCRSCNSCDNFKKR